MVFVHSNIIPSSQEVEASQVTDSLIDKQNIYIRPIEYYSVFGRKEILTPSQHG